MRRWLALALALAAGPAAASVVLLGGGGTPSTEPALPAGMTLVRDIEMDSYSGGSLPMGSPDANGLQCYEYGSTRCSVGIDYLIDPTSPGANDSIIRMHFLKDPNLGVQSPNATYGCQNGVDDDGDGNTDWPSDTTCASATQGWETVGCNDGVDNDLDGKVDFDGLDGIDGNADDDADCAGASDISETQGEDASGPVFNVSTGVGATSQFCTQFSFKWGTAVNYNYTSLKLGPFFSQTGGNNHYISLQASQFNTPGCIAGDASACETAISTQFNDDLNHLTPSKAGQNNFTNRAWPLAGGNPLTDWTKGRVCVDLKGPGKTGSFSLWINDVAIAQDRPVDFFPPIGDHSALTSFSVPLVTGMWNAYTMRNNIHDVWMDIDAYKIWVSTQCRDNVDNDGDGAVDLADTGCADENDAAEGVVPTFEIATGEVGYTITGSVSWDGTDNSLNSSALFGSVQPGDKIYVSGLDAAAAPNDSPPNGSRTVLSKTSTSKIILTTDFSGTNTGGGNESITSTAQLHQTGNGSIVLDLGTVTNPDGGDLTYTWEKAEAAGDCDDGGVGESNTFTGATISNATGVPGVTNGILSGIANETGKCAYDAVVCNEWACSTDRLWVSITEAVASSCPAPAFETAGNPISSGNASNSLGAPAGIQDNDLLVAVVYVEPSTATVTMSGFSQKERIENAGTAGETFAMEVLVKRASGESGNNYPVSTSGTWMGGQIFRVSGASTSGTALDAIDAISADNIGDSTTATALGITTTVPDTRLMFLASDYSAGTTYTIGNGFTKHADSVEVMAASKVQSAAGPTENQTATLSPSAQPWAAVLAAIKPPASCVPVACNDGTDNDGDLIADFPADPGCSASDDTTETNAAVQCDDGIDNPDVDTKIDYRSNGTGDPECVSLTDPSEDNLAPTPVAGGPYACTTGIACQMSGASVSDPDGTIPTVKWTDGTCDSVTWANPKEVKAVATFTREQTCSPTMTACDSGEIACQ